jgi:hypothetical protein
MVPGNRAECVVCNEPITNPGCLQEGVQQWLREQRQDELADEVSELTRNVFANHGSMFCIKCDSAMSLCTYCYSKEIFDLVKQRPRLVAQYLTYFNFDLDHLGWEQEARSIVE